MKTRILHVEDRELGKFQNCASLENFKLLGQTSAGALQEAAEHLRTLNIPVAFPTETVYGLGADATRSNAVKGIYQAKGRPSDNPLIIHVCDLNMLREIIAPDYSENVGSGQSPVDPIPQNYKALIERFWPGPLTIILPNPKNSKLAPEVTAGLATFGARLPDSPLALTLISLVGRPLAAPSANTSTKPSPTTAEHVLHDLDGKIELIIDGGMCNVGLESTVVDGLCEPPAVLRPGGISIDSIRKCQGWEEVTKAYQDKNEIGCQAPRAPGMKYKHYSPQAQVILYEPTLPRSAYHPELIVGNETPISKPLLLTILQPSAAVDSPETSIILPKIGIIRTKHWAPWGGLNQINSQSINLENSKNEGKIINTRNLESQSHLLIRQGEFWQLQKEDRDGHPHDLEVTSKKTADLIEVTLGPDTKQVAHNLFAALRELDDRGVDVIHIEGLEDEGDIAGAIMNRLRKAATVIK